MNLFEFSEFVFLEVEPQILHPLLMRLMLKHLDMEGGGKSLFESTGGYSGCMGARGCQNLIHRGAKSLCKVETVYRRFSDSGDTIETRGAR